MSKTVKKEKTFINLLTNKPIKLNGKIHKYYSEGENKIYNEDGKCINKDLLEKIKKDIKNKNKEKKDSTFEEKLEILLEGADLKNLINGEIMFHKKMEEEYREMLENWYKLKIEHKNK